MSPRKARQNFDEVEIRNATSQGGEPQPVNAEDEELDTVFKQFPQNEACLELWRTTHVGGKPVFLEDIMPCDFTFGNIAREYGGGKFLVKGRYKDQTVTKRSFEIEGNPFPLKRKLPDSHGSQAPQPAPMQTIQPIEIPRREDGGVDTAALVGGMMNMMKSMMVEIKSSEDQVLDKMMKYKALFGTSEKSQTPVTELISMVKQGIELGSAAGGEGGGGIPWMMILDKFQGPISDLALSIKHALTQPRPGTATLPPAGPVPYPGTDGAPGQPAQSQGEPPTMEMVLLGALREMLPMLVTGAAREADPGFYSDLLLDQIPRQFYATAKTFLDKPDCIQKLEAINPAVANYRIWFESLKAELIGALAEELGDAARSVQSEPTANASIDRSADL